MVNARVCVCMWQMFIRPRTWDKLIPLNDSGKHARLTDAGPRGEGERMAKTRPQTERGKRIYTKVGLRVNFPWLRQCCRDSWERR